MKKNILAAGTEAEAGRAEVAYRYLRDAILSNDLPGGYQCAEVEIAARIGMSRTPVHEAMTRLQEEGLVQILPRRGIIVQSLTPADLLEVYDLLIALEGAAAELLAGHTQPAHQDILTYLEDCTYAMEAAINNEDLEAWRRSDEAFHDALMSSCGNGRLNRMAAAVTGQSHRARRLTLHLRPLPLQSANEHRIIIDAIMRGDVGGAGQAARDHRRHARKDISAVLQKLPIHRL